MRPSSSAVIKVYSSAMSVICPDEPFSRDEFAFGEQAATEKIRIKTYKKKIRSFMVVSLN